MHSFTILLAGPTIYCGGIKTDERRLMHFMKSHAEYPLSDYKHNCSMRELQFYKYVTQFIEYRIQRVEVIVVFIQELNLS